MISRGFFKRAGWMFLVVLFLASALGIGLFTFWEQTHPPKTDTSQNTPPSPPPNPNQLQGKKLADFTPLTKIDSLQKIDLKEGTGTEAKATSTVTADYTGAVAATGVIFQSSLDSGQPATFPLSQVIKGWAEGVPGMKVGGERRLLIPAAEAYGANPPPNSGIPPNADLVFDITLHGVK